MNDLQIYIYSGEQLRTIQREDGLWWVLRDVCQVLGLSTPAKVAERLDTDEKAEVSLIHTSSNGVKQTRITTIINEPGLYAVILRSDKPEAKDFRRWVTHEVLPSIRKSGVYGVPPERLVRLNKLQAQLTEWRQLADDFERLTADAGRRYAAARKNYDDLRAHRDHCRASVKQCERYVADEIALLTSTE